MPNTKLVLPPLASILPRLKRVLFGVDASYGVIPIFYPKETPNDPVFLLIQHRQGHWGFPKGHPERQESPLTTALREVREETGLESPQLEVKAQPQFMEKYTFTSHGRNIRKTVTYFLGISKTQTVTPQIEELLGYKWASFADAYKLLTFEPGKKVLKDVQMHLSTI